MRSQLWLRVVGYLNYISPRYVFIYSFVKLTKYAEQKMNNMMWLRMAVELMSILFTGTVSWIISCFLTAENRLGFQ